jgi:integrase
LDEYHRTVDDLRAGRVPKPKDSDLITLKQAVNEFLTAQAGKRDSGELAPRTWTDYHSTLGRIIDCLGRHRAVADLEPADFRKLRAALGKGRSVVSLNGDVIRCRTFFKFCWVEGLIGQPVRYGSGFDLPSVALIRQARAAKGKRMFEPEELRMILAAADPLMKAWVLLAANCGFGQSDLASLPKSALDLEAGWVDFPRPKTGVSRRCRLWPETIEAVQAAISLRPEPADKADKGLVFLTPSGLRLVRDALAMTETKLGSGLTTHTDSVQNRFRKLLVKLGINGGRNFYAIRHGFQTVAERTKDFPCVDHVMGHIDGTMAGRYREEITDERLQAVADHVHAWLFDQGNKE